jgi:hypothetical protein
LCRPYLRFRASMMAPRRVYFRNFLFQSQSGECDALRELAGKSEIVDII